MTLQSITLVADSTSVTKRTTGVMKNPATCGVFLSKKNVVAQRNNCLYSNLPLVTLRAPKKCI